MTSHLHLTIDPVTRAYPKKPLRLEPEASIRVAMSALKESRLGCLLICRDKQLAGIFTERDALRLMAVGTNFDQPVESVMRSPVITVKHSETVANAISLMSEGGYRSLPVLNDEGEPIGVLSVKTILRYLVEHFPGVVYTLPPEPHHVTQLREGA